MTESEYQLRYLPLFIDDVIAAKNYIKYNLSNDDAANELVDAIEKSIIERLPICECFEPYHSIKDRDNAYYRIYIKNYVIYYVVLNENNTKIMEVRRILYKRRNRELFL